MARFGESCAVPERRLPEFSISWLAVMVGVAALLLIAVAAGVTLGGVDRLLPTGDPFIPYYTT